MTEILIVGSERDAAELAAMIIGDRHFTRIDPVDPDAASRSELQSTEVLFDISNRPAADRCQHLSALFDRGCRPRAAYVSALTMSATEAATALPGVPVASFGWLPQVVSRSGVIEFAAALQTSAKMTEALRARLLALCGHEVEVVQDRLGLISARVLAMIINEAAFAVMEGVATPEDIDTAMRLGTNYPIGPLAWVDRIGAATVVALLDALQQEYGEERYRPCVLLRQFARAGRSFHESGSTAP